MNVGTVLREHIRIRMALSACAALFAGAWSVVAGGYETVDLFGAVFSVLVTPLFTYLFYAASERNMRVSFFREFGVLAVLAVTAMALTEISSSLFALPLRASGTIEALTGEGAVLRRKTLCALAGLCCGVVTVPVLAPMYPLSAAAYALLDALRLPSVFPVVGAGVVSVAWGIFTGGVDGFTRVLPPAAVTCAVLVPLFRGDLLKTPRDLFGLSENPAGTARFGRTGDAYGTEIRAGRTENRVDSLSEGLLSVSALLRGLASRLSKPAPAELRAAVERCFENRCSRCSGREECRRKRLSRTEPLIRAMTDSLARRGSVSSALIPPSLASRCPEMGGILDDVNREAGEKLVSPGREDPLSSAASDWELAGELLSSAARSGRDSLSGGRRDSARSPCGSGGPGSAESSWAAWICSPPGWARTTSGVCSRAPSVSPCPPPNSKSTAPPSGCGCAPSPSSPAKPAPFHARHRAYISTGANHAAAVQTPVNGIRKRREKKKRKPPGKSPASPSRTKSPGRSRGTSSRISRPGENST